MSLSVSVCGVSVRRMRGFTSSFNFLWFYLIFSEFHRRCCEKNVWQLHRLSISDLQPISDKQSLLVRWKLDPSGSPNQFYEIQIGRTENRTIIYNGNVSVASPSTDEYTWMWTSDLPLECVDHSVRIRNFHNKSFPSPWSDWKTNRAAPATATLEIFPFQRVLREGSSAAFCCVPPRGVSVTSMSLDKNRLPLISVGAGVKAASVGTMKRIPEAFLPVVTVRCNDSAGNTREIWNYVSSPPQKPSNLSCVTSDTKTVTCSWDSGGNDARLVYNKRTHTLHIENSEQPPIKCEPSSCTLPAVPQLEEYNISLLVKDVLGEERGSFSFNIAHRVSPVVQRKQVSAGVTNASLSWFVQGNLTRLKLLCQVSTEPGRTTEVSCSGVSGFCNTTLDRLLPNTNFTTRVRCSADGRFWGDWTPRFAFRTYPLVTLDLWRRIEQLPDANSRQVTLLWTQSVPGSAAVVRIRGYRVQWSQDGRTRTQWEESGQTRARVSIGAERCDFSVQAVSQSGSTVPADITVHQREEAVDPPVLKRISSRDAGFYLSWQKQEAATCGYTVDWCTLGNEVPCTLEWRKLPEGNNAVFLTGNFRAGLRYTFNIYGCRENGHRLLEKQTGYLQQLSYVKPPSLLPLPERTSSSVALKWRYAEDDAAHPAFITGYLVTVQKAGSAAVLFNISVGDPWRKSVTVDGLQQDTEYVLSVSALTEEGAGRAASIAVRTAVNYSVHVVKILYVLLVLGCSVLLWPQIKRLQSELKAVLFYPAGMDIKTPELDVFLHETAERLQSQRQDDCRSCEIEILTRSPPLSEASRREPEAPNAPPLRGAYFPQRWDGADLLQSINNNIYFHTAEEHRPQTQVPPSALTTSSDLSQQACNVIYGYISKENF